jgi:hypothetical protein
MRPSCTKRFLALCLIRALPVWILLAVGPWAVKAQAQTKTKIACLGEATTHSVHRQIYDPEYPELLGIYIDTNFKVEPTPANPLDGGMLYGNGTNYRIGNFGLPTGVAFENAGPEVTPTLGSPQLMMAETFAPDVVVLGPYGPHEPETHSATTIDHFLPDFRKLAMRVMAFTSKPKVFIAIPFPRSGTAGDATREMIHAATIQVAMELGLSTIDLWNAFLGKVDEFADQNHLTEAGRTHHAQVVGDAIKAWKAGSGTGGGGAAGTVDAGGPANADAGVPGGGGRGSGGAPVSGGSPGGAGASGGATVVGSGGSGGIGGSLGGNGSGGSIPASGGSAAVPVAGTGGSPSASGGSVAHTGGTTGSSATGGGAPGSIGSMSGSGSGGCSLVPGVGPLGQGAGSTALLVIAGLIAAAHRRRRAH